LKATYQYNGLGQRISKTLPDGSGKYFIYDTAGKLMAETDINGNVLFEYIYLNGQLLAKYTPDSDSDGISNAEEDQQGTNPLSPDSDNDGLTDLAELFVHGTSISNTDTDADGISDGEEVALNSDPLNGNVAIGDINLDDQLNLADYVLLSQYVLNIRVPTPTEQAQADVNRDGILNIQDMLLMQRTLLGLQLSWSDFSAENIERIFAQFYQGIIPPAYAANGDGEIYYVHNDYLSTPVKMTNEMGLVVWQAVYDPFGNASVNEDVDGDGKVVEMNVRFPGQYYDTETGLHYNYFRTYDPELGRYLTSDPIGLFGGVNTFGYVGGNPIGFVDPLGLDKFIGWRVKEHKDWWSHYRWTKAVCQACDGKLNEVNALYEQWRPMSINTTPMPGQPGNTGAIDAIFDLYEARQQAIERGSMSKMEMLLDSPEEIGQQFCDLLK
jgi:RHS repeat-associated protein